MPPGSEPVFQYTSAIIVDLEYLKLLHERGAIWGNWTCNTAIKSGDVECLRYVLDTGAAPKYDYLYEEAIAQNNWFEFFKVIEDLGGTFQNFTRISVLIL